METQINPRASATGPTIGNGKHLELGGSSMHSNTRANSSMKAILTMLGASCIGMAGTVAAIDTTYTTDADFDNGILQSVDHDAPNINQLQVSDTIQTLPVLYVANAGEDTLSRIDTDTDCEVARYRTWFAPPAPHGAFSGPAPSRSAVDVDGNVYVLNRHFEFGAPGASA